MLNRGRCCLMRLYSSMRASTSLRTWIHSTVAALVTIWAVRGCIVEGAPK